jgi:signal transduction histidine kinase
MDTYDTLFEKIRINWLSQSGKILNPSSDIQINATPQPEEIFDLLRRSMRDDISGDAAVLVDGWMRKQSESETKSSASIYLIFSQLFSMSFQLCISELNQDEALILLEGIFKFFTNIMQYVFDKEMQIAVQDISYELEFLKLSINQLEKSKSDFISVAAHELKTPLTLIEGYASMLQDLVPKGDGVEQTEIYLKGIKTGTTRLREIVDDMIDVSLIDNNMLTLNYQPTWLNRIISLVRRELNQALMQRHQSLIIQEFPGSDIMFFADGERLYQAFRNVLANAIKYTPDGGRIIVDGRLLPGFVETIIQDTGIGIAPEDQTKIFEKFGRLGSVSTHSTGKIKFKGGGPGLGLSITKGIINAHGGTIWVESSGYDEKNCPGSTFHILLPLRTTSPDKDLINNLESYLHK